MAEEDDPVIASYDVVFSDHQSQTSSHPKLLVLQYPAHRQASRPYSAARSQKPTSFRMRPKTGIVEMEVPMMTNEHYSVDDGERYGRALSESRTAQAGGSYGLAGGFQPPPQRTDALRDIPPHPSPVHQPSTLTAQTLGGKVAEPSERDPIYLVGAVKGDQVHLSLVNAVVQMRPQLHHIDAEEENSQKRLQMGAAGATGKVKAGLEKTESRAIEFKFGSTREDPRDRGLNDNTKMLREIQREEWRSYAWADQDEEASKLALQNHSVSQWAVGSDKLSAPVRPKLKSTLSNGDWLDKMSAPREDGKKGLLAKLRGRERERARRKKAEEAKKTKAKDSTAPSAAAVNSLLEQSSASDLSSPEVSDLEPDVIDIPVSKQGAGAPPHGTEDVRVKEEPEDLTTTTTQTSAPRKRGRPKKTPASSAVNLD